MTWNNAGMQSLIPVTNKVQDVLNKAGSSESFELPRIAVVGGQSSGKSSVLESLVGRDFLPRGNGIVTRVPLILKLIQDQTEFARFQHKEDKIFTDFDQVRKEIDDETMRITNGSKNISSTPITLEVHSPHVLNLTLIDLPGIIKIAIEGQSEDIEEQIRDMILNYIKDDSCLILAVTPANQDLANSDALKIAKEVDPEGNRTIGVLTKIDLMDKGTDARDILENRGACPLKRGYIGVVNRSQKDINEKKNIKYCLDQEKKFFAQHPAYRHLTNKHGTPYLQQALNQQLMEHIRDSLPKFRKSLLQRFADVEPEALKYLSQQFDDRGESKMLTTRNKIVQQFIHDVEAAIDGSCSQIVSTKKLTRGAYINRIFHKKIPAQIDLANFLTPEMKRKIQITIENVHGVHVGHFIPDKAFRIITKELIESLRFPAQNCVKLVASEVSTTIKEAAASIKTYPRLRNEIEKIASTELLEKEKYAKTQISFMFDCELSYMNTNHVDFNAHDGQNGRDGLMVRPNQDQNHLLRDAIEHDELYDPEYPETERIDPLEAEELEVNADSLEAKKVLGLVNGYLPIVTKTIRDLVLKCIMLVVIDQLIGFLKAELLVRLDREDKSVLMEESELEVELREKTLREYEAITEALETINKTNMVKLDMSAKSTFQTFEAPETSRTEQNESYRETEELFD
ncbi:unnamed protein product, partial [Mesorhabditis belari]|uniref:dynamin GTPase n=1 Tax=Mesorhabditis belari TaxID=2138241 RepID=A0AAF3EZ88_9BILA